jgi:predicted HTH transcriptional regulator
MPFKRSETYLINLVDELRKLPKETEWVEFKRNKAIPHEIGEYLSALANSAALSGRASAYLVWGIDDVTHEVTGTEFDPHQVKIGNEELENWLLRLLTPQIPLNFYSLFSADKRIVVLELAAAASQPIQFQGVEFIRIGSYKKKLKDFPESARELWRHFDKRPFESGIAAGDLTADETLSLLDYPAYFQLTHKPLPAGRTQILSTLAADNMISPTAASTWDISNLGAILFASKLSRFESISRKAARIVWYKGNNRIETVRERSEDKGYAVVFEGVMEFINTLLPTNEVIHAALREEVRVFPELAIRELLANALIHQDFQLSGTGPLVEIFTNRLEITNPGKPLVTPDRFLDSPPQSRNEALASFMRRIGICEERGSGVDKVVLLSELYQLPAPTFATSSEHTRSTLYAHKSFKNMDKQDRIHAAYLHACLRYVQCEPMTNATLRKRFGITEKNSAMASRVISDTIQAQKIKLQDQTVGNRARKYLPWWA